MNPFCVACQNIATRVCIHPQCEVLPFLCDKRCKNNVAEIMHTHNKSIKTIPFSQLDQQISNIAQTNKKDTLNSFKKRIQMILLELNQLLKQIQDKFNTNNLRLSQNSNTLISKIFANDNQGLRGKDIHNLLSKKNIFDNQKNVEKNIKQMTKQYNTFLLNIENIIHGKVIKNEKQQQPIIKQEQPELKFYKYFKAGKQLIEKQQYLSALKQLFKAQQFNPFDPQNQANIGNCLGALTTSDEINQYNYSIELGAQCNILHLCFSGIAKCYLFDGKFKQALEIINKALQNNPIQSLFLIKGLIYTKMQSPYQALIAFSEGIQKKPTRQLYSSRALCYLSLGMIQEAQQDRKQMLLCKKQDS